MDNNYDQQSSPYMSGDYGNPGNSYNYGSAPEPQKAPNIFQQFVLAFMPHQYGRLVKVRTGSMIGFVTLLTLIATVLSLASLAVGLSAINGRDWTDVLPDFEVSGGRLYIDEDFVYDDGPLFVYMTDDINRFTYDDVSGLVDSGYRNILLAGRDSLSIMQNGRYQQYEFKSLGNEIEINKRWIVETFMPIVAVIFVVVYIIFFVGRTLWYFFSALLYALCGWIIAQVQHKTYPLGDLYRTAVYSKVLMFVVALIFDVIPLPLPEVSGYVRILITLVFMGFAIAKLPEKN